MAELLYNCNDRGVLFILQHALDKPDDGIHFLKFGRLYVPLVDVLAIDCFGLKSFSQKLAVSAHLLHLEIEDFLAQLFNLSLLMAYTADNLLSFFL